MSRKRLYTVSLPRSESRNGGQPNEVTALLRHRAQTYSGINRGDAGGLEEYVTFENPDAVSIEENTSQSTENKVPSSMQEAATQRDVRALFDRIRKLNDETCTKSPCLRILLIGKTGVGKSSLINALFDDPDRASVGDGDSTTDNVKEHELKVDGVSITVVDTPGLDKLSGKEGKDYLEKVKSEYDRADLVLFCFQMIVHVRHDDWKTMKFLRTNFGERLMAKMVVVLTFANLVQPRGSQTDPEKAFQMKFESVKEVLKERMIAAGYSEKMIEHTQFVAAGDPFSRSLPALADYRDDWVNGFIVGCLKSGITDNVKAALLRTRWKAWAANATMGGTIGTVGLSTGIGLIIAGVVTIPALPLGATLIGVGGLTLIAYGCCAVAPAALTGIQAKKRFENKKVANRLKELKGEPQKKSAHTLSSQQYHTSEGPVAPGESPLPPPSYSGPTMVSDV